MNDQMMTNDTAYMDSVHKWGRIWNLSVMGILFLYPLVVALVFGAVPDGKGLLVGLIATAPMYWAVGIVETFTYIPMLGAGGSYLSFVTGNISNLKLPCALNALEQAEVKANSDEGEVISTISIATSSIMTIVIIFIGVCLLTVFQDFFEQEWLKPAFDNVLPALFGGLGVVYLSRYFKIAVLPMTLMVLLFVFVPYLNSGMVGIMIPVSMVITLVYSRILYNKERKANGEK